MNPKVVSMVNPLLPGVLFLCPLKASENCRFSYVCIGYKNGKPGSNGLNQGNLLNKHVTVELEG